MEDMLWRRASPGLVTEAWDVTEAGNMTVTGQEAWRVALDKTFKIILTTNTIALMLGMGSAIEWRELWHHVRRPVGAVLGMLGQFVLLPAIGFVLCLLFQLRPYEALGVLLVSCCPGGIFSNFFTFWVDGDLALSIMMTTSSSLLALAGMPFNLWMYSHYWLTDDGDTIVIPFGNIIMSLALITMPVVVGMVVRQYHPRVATIITKVASLMGWLGALTAISFALILFWEAVLMTSPLMYLDAFLLPLLGFLLAYSLAKAMCQSHQVARTIGIETGSQNSTVAANIIFLSFSDPTVKAQVIVFPALYTVIMVLEAVLGIGAFLQYKKKCTSDSPVASTVKSRPGTGEEGELEDLN